MVLLLSLCLSIRPSIRPSVRPSVRLSILTQCASGLSYVINFILFCYCCYISILSTYGMGKSLEPKKKENIEGFIRNGVNKYPGLSTLLIPQAHVPEQDCFSQSRRELATFSASCVVRMVSWQENELELLAPAIL